MEIFSAHKDEVINSSVSIGHCSYRYALDNFLPLLNKFSEQRRIQNKSFYGRLKRDIIKGCIMPPITLAFDHSNLSDELEIDKLKEFILENISNGYILDGLQRLNTLDSASHDSSFNENKILPVNIIIAKRYDLLLYRMITLNNGQKPMTARHQIEMLTRNLIDKPYENIEILTEKETETQNPRGAFKKSDISEAYIAFMSNNLHNKNSRIIAVKLDELLVGRIMDSNISDSEISFEDILNSIDHLSANTDVKNWLRLGNNLIGFSLGAKKSLLFLKNILPADFALSIERFETALKSLETSKVNVGKVRREWSEKFIGKIDYFLEANQEEYDEAFSELTLTD